MKVSLAFASLVAVAGSTNALAVDLNRRAVNCPTILSSLAAAGETADAQTFCRRRLAIKQVIATQTNTKTAQTTVTARSTALKVRTVVPPTTTINTQVINTVRQTVTPGTSTVQATVHSTAYVDDDGSTIALMKRAAPTEAAEADDDDLEKRQAIAQPDTFDGLNNADLNAACRCLNLQPVTLLRTATATATSTIVKVQLFTAQATTTAPVPLFTKTMTQLKTLTVTAPPPLFTQVSVVIDLLKQCPPTMASTFICPVGTAADDGSAADQTQLACGVTATDGFQGYCTYWSDDGSPANSQPLVMQTDGSESGQQYRDAVYGDNASDDCPAWSDYVCSAKAGQKRRWFEDSLMTPNNVARSALTARRERRPIPANLQHSGKLRHTFRENNQ